MSNITSKKNRGNSYRSQSLITAAVCLASAITASAITNIDLSTYVRIGRYSLPEPTRTTPPNSTNLLCQEASGVAYNWDTDTLFIVGDGARSVTQVSKTGVLIDTMTLALGSSPQGTDFYDPEGITYIGGGQFVFSEERDRQLVKFTYAAGTVLSRTNAQTVKLGTFVENIGTEGLSFDPQTGGFICVKEVTPIGVFQTDVDFNAGTASNGSPTTENSTNLFDPALLGVTDLADVFALSNIPALTNQPASSRLLLLSQENARVLNVDRFGNIYSTLQIVADFGSPKSATDQQHEGLTMDTNGILYVVNENGGGNIDYPELWVYGPSALPNQAPTALIVTNTVNSIAENTSTASAIKVADIYVVDDGLGTNVLSVSGADATDFQITGTSLYLKAGTVLDYETKTDYAVTVNVNDVSFGNTPGATNNYTLTVTDVVNEFPTNANITLIISEVSPWSSGSSPVAADWFEVSNTGTNIVNITGWKVDDSSAALATAAALNGVTNIAPGESVIFIETANPASAKAAFVNTWFGVNAPTNLQIGSYTGSGLGLSTGGDGVCLFDTNGVIAARVVFGTSPAGPRFGTFDNAAGINGTNVNLTRLSAPRVYGAFIAANDYNEIGSPGSIGGLIISEVAPWSSGNSPVAADWFEVINTSPNTINITGWKVDDDSKSFAIAGALNGVTNIAPGEAVVFIDTATLVIKSPLFLSNWFGANPPATLQIGSYTGAGGLSTSGDQVNLFDSIGTLRASVVFGSSPSIAPLGTFDNSFGLNDTTISQISTVGVHSAFVAVTSANEIGSPGTGGKIVISEVSPWSSGNSPVAGDWFELSNTGSTPLDILGWKMDDNSQSPAGAVALVGITNIAPGESVIFIESTSLTNAQAAFRSNWFGASVPAGLQIGSYTGSGVGLGTGGDAVNIYSSNNVLQASVSFGASPVGPFATFDNGGGLNNANITQLSAVNVNGAFVAVNSAAEIGSPGIMQVPGLTLTRSGTNALIRWSVDATGFRLEDNSTLGLPGSWTNVALSVVISNGQLNVTAPMTNSSRYFRLRK